MVNAENMLDEFGSTLKPGTRPVKNRRLLPSRNSSFEQLLFVNRAQFTVKMEGGCLKNASELHLKAVSAYFAPN